MKIVLRAVVGISVLFGVLMVVQMIAAESGEVVVLTTRTIDGPVQETRLWVVDHEGKPWLRSGTKRQRWYANLLADANVEMLRGDARQPYSAVPAKEATDAINRLMRDKYGWADAYIGFLFGRDASVPIRLEARTPLRPREYDGA